MDNNIHPNITTAIKLHHTQNIISDLITDNSYSLDNIAIITTALVGKQHLLLISWKCPGHVPDMSQTCPQDRDMS